MSLELFGHSERYIHLLLQGYFLSSKSIVSTILLSVDPKYRNFPIPIPLPSKESQREGCIKEKRDINHWAANQAFTRLPFREF